MSEIHAGPLTQADPDGEHQAGPLVHATARPQKPRKSWREQRWERRRRRRMVEEVLGWIVVPLVLFSVYWGVTAGLEAFGTTPTALIQNIRSAVATKS